MAQSPSPAPTVGRWCAAALLVCDGRYLMQLRDDKPDILLPGHWSLFGGTVDPGEDADAAIVRELIEELEFRPKRVEPFTVYTDPIPQGYDPGKLQLWTGDAWNTYGPRPAGAHLSDLTGPFASRPGAKLAVQAKFRDVLTQAATTGSYSLLSPPLPVTIDNLGDTEEANAGSADPQKQTYGNFHNDGHIHFMAFDNRQPYGVMADTSTAVRDPIFFRWHKQVDVIFHAFQDTLPPYDFSRAPRARIRPGDIFLVTGGDPAPVAAGEFGGAHWDDDLAAGAASGIGLTGELTTQMLTRDIDAVDANGNPIKVPIDYLSHDDFWYVLRVENLLSAVQAVTIRIFIAPRTKRSSERCGSRWTSSSTGCRRASAPSSSARPRPRR